MVRVHNEACHTEGVSFIPLVAESLGGWSEKAILNITRIGRLLGQRTGTPTIDTTRHLLRLFVSLWKRNTILWLTRFPTVSAWIDGKI